MLLRFIALQDTDDIHKLSGPRLLTFYTDPDEALERNPGAIVYEVAISRITPFSEQEIDRMETLG